jgi:Holliday junction resolvase
MTGGRASRQKGDRFERSIVHLFQEYGISSERIPLSGSAGGKFIGDVSVAILGNDRTIEAKVRKTGFAQVYRWLASHYAVAIRADRAEPLVCLRLRDFAELAIAADRKRVGQ